MDIHSTAGAIPEVVRPQHITKTNDQGTKQAKQDEVQLGGRQENLSTEVQDKIDSMNDLLSTTPTSIKFNLHEGLDRIYVQVVDLQTKEVVKEIPPEEFLDMVASMLKNAGLIVDERV